MAKAVSGIFTLTDAVSLNNGQSGAANSSTMDIGHMIQVSDRQALEILSVDYLWQNTLTEVGTYSPALGACFGADASTSVQLSDVNPGGSLRAAYDRQLISSTNLHYGHGDNIFTNVSDFQPDDFKGSEGQNGRFVVNDTLYIVADPSVTIVASNACMCTLRIRARIVQLSVKDYVALSLETGPL